MIKILSIKSIKSIKSITSLLRFSFQLGKVQSSLNDFAVKVMQVMQVIQGMPVMVSYRPDCSGFS